MANMLAWLTGRDDQTAQPSPVQYGDGQQSLTAYHPSPSEQFSGWLTDLLGGGPQASLAHQNFAEGVPKILAATPLGLGLSAADFAHAKAANDPMGAAAAAIGLIPGAGPEVRAGVSGLQQELDTLLAKLPQLKSTASKPSFDYEKDDTGLYHIFDALTGKTQKVVDSALEAKNWITGQTTGKSTVPINQISSGSPMKAKAPDLIEAQKRYEAAIAPLAQNLPERAQAQGYTTPAFRGMKIRSGDVNPVYQFEQGNSTAGHYATDNPMLADMYSDYLSKHPGWQVPENSFDKGAAVSPLLLDTSKYHYYDAKGAHWSSAQGNQRGIQQARAAGAPGVIVDNVWDEPNSTHALGTPSKVYITFPEGATTVKSRFAQKFDPNSPNMLQSLLAMLGAGGAVGASQGDQKQ